LWAPGRYILFAVTAEPLIPLADEIAALIGWLDARYGRGVALAEPATSKGEGFDSDVYLVRFSGDALPEEWRRPLVLRIKSDGDRLDEARHEAATQAWLANRGYPAPRVLEVFAPGALLDRPAQVMERAPGALMLDSVVSKPWRALRAVRQLASLHVQLHTMPIDDFPVGDDLLDRRLRLPRHAAEELGDESLRAGLDRVMALAPRLRESPPSVCHGDFHPLNVLLDGEHATVIDWTDAGIGDRHGDVARTLVLFDVAAIAASNAGERVALRAAGPRLGKAYRRAYHRALPLDPERVNLWKPVHLLHGWSQALSLHAGMFDRGDGHDDRHDRVPPKMVAELDRRFHAAIARVSP
jgi:aminoglycoside phosphotransferase (APT) family kinase protein